VLFPLLVATEVVVLVRAAREGWLKAKLRAWGSLARRSSTLIRWRGAVQRTRRVSDREVLEPFCAGMDTELLRSNLLRRANPWLERYRRVTLRLLGSP
jgi:hypothetical protein